MHEAEARTRQWMDEAVIGLNLCPFAAAPARRGQVRIAVCELADEEEAAGVALDELERLWDAEPEVIATTLIVYTAAFRELDELLDVAGWLEGCIEQVGLSGEVQVATFHPEYLFEGEAAEGLSHWTNRAPYATLHLIREDDLSAAIARHPDPEGIPAANIQTLERLGADRVAAMWAAWRVGDTP